MTYLFFDIECANSFGGIGKICSFGFVLCNSDFSVIETADLLMNPDAPFDWYLFKKGSKCNLAYSQSEYKKNPKFPHYFSKIQSLLSANDRLVFGFGCKNDVATISSECVRYNLPQIEFKCFDIHNMLEKFYETQGGLGPFVEKLGIDTHGMEFHDSRADAYFTMKVTEKLLADSKMQMAELLKAYTPLSSERSITDLKKKLFKKWLERNEEKKASEEKPRRVPKKVTVPEWFDWKREFVRQGEIQSR